jgi:hypothetical protein
MRGAAIAILPWFLVGAACSSSSTPTTHDAGEKDAHAKVPDGGKKPTGKDAASDTGSTGASDAKPHVINDPMNCVMPGAASNTDGVGGYCSPAGGQCAHAITGGMASICTGDLPGTPPHDWFCTVVCTTASECGTGSSCIATNGGQLCVPTACVSLIGDAALSDSPSDAPSDAHGDAGKSDGAAKDAAPDAEAHDAAHDGAAPDAHTDH